MKQIIIILTTTAILGFTLTSCQWAKDKSKNAVHKAGEIVGKTGSEFGDGVYEGVKKTFENEVNLSKPLQSKGIEFGEVVINSTDSTTDNVLTAYIIFNEKFDQDLTIKLFNDSGKEYGRVTKNVKGEKGAQHFDFIFNKQVSIGVKGNITVE